jgi:exosome complex component MTR3
MAQSGYDRRRVNGPSESFQPIFEDEPDVLYKDWKLGERRRNRQAEDIRPICGRHRVILLTLLANSK